MDVLDSLLMDVLDSLLMDVLDSLLMDVLDSLPRLSFYGCPRLSLVEAGEEFALFFDGMNEAQTGNAVSLTMHRIKFSPVQGVPFISDEFAEISMEFELLRDTSKTGTGISQFMKVVQAL
ncbi:hypothetical protein [Endozoicomonas sp.]|uniref:hypothetical protein n=1 Tax=Endozoicomonas sp. TaxID=1892382 RepID=UPI00383A3C7C